MEDTIVNALVSAGGYAVLCYVMLRSLENSNKLHRDEVHELSEVVRENTSAISSLVALLNRVEPGG